MARDESGRGAVLFDLDNTLHDRDAGVAAFLRVQHRARGIAVPFDLWHRRFAELEDRGRIWKDVVYRELCGEFDLEIDPGELLAEYERGFARHVVPFAGLRATLVELRARGWRTGIVSNGRTEFQRRTFAALAIDALVDVIVISEEVGLRKPDPAIFRLALDRIGCDAERSWFVGDDPVADFGGARDAGMRALLFAPGRYGENGSVSRLLDLPDRIEAP